MHDPIVIVGAARTPLGAFQGELSGLTASDLGAVAIKAAVARAGVAPERVEQVYFGNCLMAGQGQAPARQAMLKGGLPASCGAITLSKMCGSGMQAVMLGCDAIAAGSHDIVLAGGMESMSNAPYLVPKARGGYRIGHGLLLDHMMLDGLEDAYTPGENGGGRSMGQFAEDCATRYGFTREQQDAYALTSITRAREAIASGAFEWEVAAVTLSGRDSTSEIATDEGPRRARPEKIAQLKPAFKKEGTVTAASSSSINDGAAALVLMRASMARELGCPVLARIVAHATHAQEPGWFSTAPVGAIDKLYKKTGWCSRDVDCFEINEAFACVPMAAMQELSIPHEKLNMHGGACVLGHPIGASGARILVTLLGCLRKRGGGKGVASLCIGGGEATALAVQMD